MLFLDSALQNCPGSAQKTYIPSFFVDQGSTFYINGKPKNVKSACGAI